MFLLKFRIVVKMSGIEFLKCRVVCVLVWVLLFMVIKSVLVFMVPGVDIVNRVMVWVDLL